MQTTGATRKRSKPKGRRSPGKAEAPAALKAGSTKDLGALFAEDPGVSVSQADPPEDEAKSAAPPKAVDDPSAGGEGDGVAKDFSRDFDFVPDGEESDFLGALLSYPTTCDDCGQESDWISLIEDLSGDSTRTKHLCDGCRVKESLRETSLTDRSPKELERWGSITITHSGVPGLYRVIEDGESKLEFGGVIASRFVKPGAVIISPDEFGGDGDKFVQKAGEREYDCMTDAEAAAAILPQGSIVIAPAGYDCYRVAVGGNCDYRHRAHVSGTVKDHLEVRSKADRTRPSEWAEFLEGCLYLAALGVEWMMRTKERVFVAGAALGVLGVLLLG
jgi:hypothetical protein